MTPRVTASQFRSLKGKKDHFVGVNKMVKQSPGEALFSQQLELSGITGWLREHRFHPTRKWRFDFAHPEKLIAVEVEGVTCWGAIGRHQNPKGYEADCEKYAEALILGWRVLRVTQGMVKSGMAISLLQRLLEVRT